MLGNFRKSNFSRGSRKCVAPLARGRCAFTLIEIIVVLVILAIAAVMIVPYATSAASIQASSAARLIMSDLEYAQNQAITTQEPISVTFNVSGDSYTLSNASDPLIHPITKQTYVMDFDTMAGFENVSVSSADFGGASVVTFDALGAPDNDGTVTIVAGSHTYTITVSPVSGRVTVSDE